MLTKKKKFIVLRTIIGTITKNKKKIQKKNQKNITLLKLLKFFDGVENRTFLSKI